MWRAAVASLTVVLAAACSSAHPVRRPASPAVNVPMRFSAPLGVPRGTSARTPQSALTAYVARASAFHRWGLAGTTRLPPPPPRHKPVLVPGFPGHRESGLPPVVSRVPTRDKVVFLTADDGTYKDRSFLRMMYALNIPITSFLTHHEAGNDYGYFRAFHRLGGGVQNHTLSHPVLSRLSPAEQRREICGQQQRLSTAFGERPTLFRPPYGDYDSTTLRAARSCGLRAAVLWGLEAWPQRIDWQRGDHRLQPGDIILTHFRDRSQWNGSMDDMARRMLRTVMDQGFAVARLEDYL